MANRYIIQPKLFSFVILVQNVTPTVPAMGCKVRMVKQCISGCSRCSRYLIARPVTVDAVVGRADYFQSKFRKWQSVKLYYFRCMWNPKLAFILTLKSFISQDKTIPRGFHLKPPFFQIDSFCPRN